MALPKTNISRYMVCKALGTNLLNIGRLCTHQNINMWSKWKPIRGTMNEINSTILQDNGYGLSVLKSNNISDLAKMIDSAGGVGISYLRPRSGDLFRLGDFRNYDLKAISVAETTEETYQQVYKGLIDIGGVTSSNHKSYEIPIDGRQAFPTDTSLGVDDIYVYYNRLTGDKMAMRRAAYVTDGYNSAWYTDILYWWTSDMQVFKNKIVTIYECYTNVVKGSDGVIYHPDDPDTTGSSPYDVFMALPTPKYLLKVTSSSPSGSKKIGSSTICIFSDDSYQFIDCSLQFTAKQDIYSGNVYVENIIVSLYRSREEYAEAIDQWKYEDRIYVPKGQVAPIPAIKHTLRNRAEGGIMYPNLTFKIYGTVDGITHVYIGGGQVLYKNPDSQL